MRRIELLMYYLSSVLIRSESIRGLRLTIMIYNVPGHLPYNNIQIFAYNEMLGQAIKI